MKLFANWAAIGAMAGVLGLVSTLGLKLYEMKQEKAISESPNVSTTGENSPVIIGNTGDVKVD